jgi:hypothetical protein
MPITPAPTNQSYLDPAADGQRNNITQALMGVSAPPPQTPMMAGPPLGQQAGQIPPPIPQQGVPMPQIQPPGAPPIGMPTPGMPPQGLPIPPRTPVIPGMMPPGMAPQR